MIDAGKLSPRSSRLLRMSIFALASALCLAGAGCRAPATKLVPASVLAGAGLKYYWPAPLELVLDEGEKVTRVQLLDEKLYCLTNLNRLLAIDAAMGLQKWSYEIIEFVEDKPIRPPADEPVFRAIHVDGLYLSKTPLSVIDIEKGGSGDGKIFDAVIINTNHFVLVLDRATGELYRKIPFKSFSATSAGAADHSYFYSGSTTGAFHSVALNEAEWVWSLPTGGMISAPLAVFHGRLFVAGEDRTLYSAEVGLRGKVVWRTDLAGPVTVSFHVDERGCFVPCEDNRLYAFDPMNGTHLWRPIVFDGRPTGAVQVGERTLFQHIDTSGLYAIDLTNGQERWRMAEGRQVLAVADGVVYIATEDNKLVAVDEMLGEKKHTLPLIISGKGFAAVNATKPVIYVATPDGRVYCIVPSSQDRLTPEMLKGK